MAKSNSLTGVLNPVKTPALKRIGQSISVTNTLAVQSYKVTSEWVLGFCITVSCSSLFSAVYQFSYRSSTFAHSPPAFTDKGLLVSTSPQQPVLEWHCGKSRSDCKGNQTARGALNKNLVIKIPCYYSRMCLGACIWVKLCGCGCRVGGVTCTYSSFLWSCSSWVLWKRMWAGTEGSTSFIEQSAVRARVVYLTDFLCNSTLCVCVCARADIFVITLAITCAFVNYFKCPAGHIRVNPRRETAHRGPQFG